MPYPVNLLPTIADCNLVLADAAEERTDLEYRQAQLQRIQTMGTGRAAEISAELSGASAEYATLTTLLATMADGPTKKKNQREHKRLEYRIYVLTEQQASGNAGIVAQFKRQYELNSLALQLQENTTLRTEVEAHLATL